MMEKTLSIVKPDGVSRNLIGDVIGRLEKEGLKICAIKMIQMSKAQAKGFIKCMRANHFLTVLPTLCRPGHVLS